MTLPAQENQPEVQKSSDKEINFRKLEEKYERLLAQERQAREDAERKAQAARVQSDDDEDDDADPYVDKRKLEKKFVSFEKKMEERIDKKAEEKARSMLYSEKKDSWLRNNPDFYDVMQHAEKFAMQDPELAETILEMPEGFERQKLVYKNIKALGLHKAPEKAPSIQDKIDANRRSPYYQGGGVGTAPYNSQGDFSKTGQKSAYDKMQELKSRLRLG